MARFVGGKLVDKGQRVTIENQGCAAGYLASVALARGRKHEPYEWSRVKLAHVICMLVLTGSLHPKQARTQPLAGCEPPTSLTADLTLPNSVVIARIDACRAALKVQANDREILFRLASALLAGHQYRDAINRDLAAARSWYEKAAANGDASAMNQLVFYLKGMTVPSNLELPASGSSKPSITVRPKQ